jgi:hypothetical protein
MSASLTASRRNVLLGVQVSGQVDQRKLLAQINRDLPVESLPF